MSPRFISEAKTQAMLTTISDTAYTATGTPACRGQLTISWPAFQASDARSVRPGYTQVALTNGQFSIALEPGVTARPPFCYHVLYQLTNAAGEPSSWQEQWNVPESSSVQTIADVLSPPA